MILLDFPVYAAKAENDGNSWANFKLIIYLWSYVHKDVI